MLHGQLTVRPYFYKEDSLLHCHLCCMDGSLLDLISIRKTHYLTLHAGWLTDGIFSKRKTYCLLLLYGEWLIAESRFYKEGSLFDITLQRMTPWILFQKGRLTVCYNFMQDDSLLSLVSIRNAHKILLLDAGWLIAESGFYKERSLYSILLHTWRRMTHCWTCIPTWPDPSSSQPGKRTEFFCGDIFPGKIISQ